MCPGEVLASADATADEPSGYFREQIHARRADPRERLPSALVKKSTAAPSTRTS
ncbi:MULTISPECIES: hypothetical protein [unclassified Streptomyces]|uniref:hypothetical protein n=1 Tax=unclassified Streptomyces TaxID=2593676 RepID=UPI0033231467